MIYKLHVLVPNFRYDSTSKLRIPVELHLLSMPGCSLRCLILKSADADVLVLLCLLVPADEFQASGAVVMLIGLVDMR